MEYGVYYRIYFTSENKVAIVCVQWFDENDYDADRFLSSGKYYSELEAIKYLTKQYNAGKTRGVPVVNNAVQNFLGNNIKNILD